MASAGLPDAVDAGGGRVDLSTRAVIVTGAGRGLGRAYARHAAASGAWLVVNDLDASAAEETAASVIDSGGRAVVSAHSVCDDGDVEEMIETCLTAYGSVDGLVNNAGVFSVGVPWEEPAESTRRLVETNVVGTILCGTAAMRIMVEQGRGVIVNVTSGAHLGLAGMATYGATKGAVASLTYCWAADLAGTGVRVCGLSPVATTRMTRQLGDHDAPLGAEPDSVAPIVTYLLGDGASGTNGRIVRFINSEVSLLERPRFTAARPSQGSALHEVMAGLLGDAATNLSERGAAP